MPHPATLLSLPDELIVEILTKCSIQSVLQVERTCKGLHEICKSRPIWMALIHALDIEYAPNINPFETLDAFSTPDLRNKVVNAMRRYHGWEGGDWLNDLEVIDLPIHRPPENADRIVEPRLLPGGKHILVLNSGLVELWSIESKECVWVIRSSIGRFSCAGFDFEVVNGGNTLMIAILFEDFELSTMSPLRIYAYDLTNNTHELKFERVLPPVFLFRMMLRNDFFIACVPRTFQTVVINWRTGEALMLNFVDSTGARVDPRSIVLADNDIISFANVADIGFAAIKLPLSSLKDHWSTAEDFTIWSHHSICPSREGSTILPLPYPDQRESVENRNDGFGPWILAHRVFTPTWKLNTPTEIFLAAYDCGPGGQTPTRLVSFRLQLSHTNKPSLDSDKSKLKIVASSCAQASQLPWNSRSLSNAGRMFSLRSKLRCFRLFADNVQPINELTLGQDIVPCADELEPIISSVEPWSGAIAIGMPGTVKIINFA